MVCGACGVWCGIGTESSGFRDHVKGGVMQGKDGQRG